VDKRKQLLTVLRLADILRVTVINLKVTGSYPKPTYLSGKLSQMSFSKRFKYKECRDAALHHNALQVGSYQRLRRLDAGTVRVGFVVDKVALKKGCCC
jgi:hypothetical protein